LLVFGAPTGFSCLIATALRLSRFLRGRPTLSGLGIQGSTSREWATNDRPMANCAAESWFLATEADTADEVTYRAFRILSA
jgi:hypothetical protein